MEHGGGTRQVAEEDEEESPPTREDARLTCSSVMKSPETESLKGGMVVVVSMGAKGR